MSFRYNTLYTSIFERKSVNNVVHRAVSKKMKKIWDVVSDLELDYEVIISPTVIPYTEFETYKDILPYYRNIAQEGAKLSA